MLVKIHGSNRSPQVFLRGLNGQKVTFTGTTSGMVHDHSGVGLDEIRVDPFLNAAREANLEKPNGSDR